MIPCKTHQSRLLHHLYGLLDDAEHQSLTAHLATCESCRAALDNAREQQQLLAAAAKTSFPDIRFEPATLPIQRAPLKTKPQRPWRRWAIAATIFLAIGGPLAYTAIAWLVHTSAVSRAQSALAQATRDRDQLLSKQTAEQQTLNAEIAALNKQIELVELQYRNDLIKIKKEYDSQPVQFTVTHPKTLQAGGVNELKIEAKRKPGLANDAKLLAMVVDSKTNAEIARTSLKEGTTDFVLPANLPLKPGVQLSLRLLAVQPDGKEEQTLVNEILPLVTSLYVTHIMTDRPMYRPGELVHFRSLTLERFSLQPAEEVFELRYRLVRMLGDQEQVVEVRQPGSQQPAQMIGASKLKDKDGKALLGPDGKEMRGIGAGTFQLPDELPGGEYSLIVSEAYDRFPPEKRKVLVNRYQAPRLLKDVDFTRKSYGPGDLVTVTCKVAPAEGGRILANQPVKLVAEVDKLECAKLENLKTDDKGQCVAQFRLPQKIERGEGVLTVTFTDGANVETTVEPINIILNKLAVEFFPEGGYLIAGAPNRVYFQVRTLLGKPAELSGKIVNKAGQAVATIQTVNDHKEIGVNQGMGRFDFTPVKGEHYELKIDSPTGIEGTFLVSPVQNDGVVLHLPQGVVTNKIDVVLHSIGKDRKLLVGAYCRGQLLDHESATVAAGQSKSLTLKPASAMGGVYRITVFEVLGDNKLDPLAERLIYRHSPDKLNLQLFTDKNSYTPGDRVTLSLKATDQHNKPAPAIVVVSVVDKSILKLRNDRTARAMPSHFLLTSEVRGPEDLEYADFLLLDQSKSDMGLDVAKAHVALDLLLGTHGWRRFIEQKKPGKQDVELPAMFKEDAKRFAKRNGQTSEQLVQDTSDGRAASKVMGEAAVKHEKLQRELGSKEAAIEAKWEGVVQEYVQLEKAIASQESALSKAEDALADINEGLDTFSKPVAPFMIVGTLIASVLLVLVGMTRINLGRRGAAHVVTGLWLFLALTVGGGIFLVCSKSEDRVMASKFSYFGNALRRAEAAAAQDRSLALPNPPPMAMAVEGNARAKEFKQFIKLENAAEKALTHGTTAHGLVVFDDSKSMKFDAAEALVKVPPSRLKLQDSNGFIAGTRKATTYYPRSGVKLMAGEYYNEDELLRKFKLFADVTKDHLESKQKEADFGKQSRVITLILADAFSIREYAHQHPTNPDNIRRDFAETVYWHPALVLPGDKALDVSFDLSDAVTQWQVTVYGHTKDGRLGALTHDIASRLPFSLDAKLPIEISNTDKLAIPIALANDSDKNRHVKLTIEADKLKIDGKSEHLLQLNANARLRQIVKLEPSIVQGEAKLRLLGTTDPFGADSIERTFKIVPEGFPVAGKHSGMLDKTEKLQIKLPAQRGDWVPGTLKLRAEVVPSTLADLMTGLDSLLREPGGCFEQTSSSNYPNILILDYLKESGQINPALEKSALAMLERGYARLITFECVNPKVQAGREGYEWFGNTAPPHPALTAYGLLQFTDMAKYVNVDKAMLARTQGWLLSQRDKKGGFLPDNRRLDKIGKAPDQITNAYILWALCEADVREDLTLELNTVAANANKSEDPYMLALASLSLMKRGQHDKAAAMLKTLQAMQNADGSLTSKSTSITLSGGSQLMIETTSLAVLAWQRASKSPSPDAGRGQGEGYRPNVQKAVTYLGKQRGGFGGYGSTQSTVLALKALVGYTRDNKRTAESGELKLIVNGREAAVKTFTAGVQDPIVIELPDDKSLTPDDNAITLEITGKNVFPYTLTWSYMALTPANKESCPVKLETRTLATKVKEGESLRVTAILTNVSGQDQGMAVAIIGLPGGCMLPADMQELRKLVQEKKIDAFEIRGRELVLYWRVLAKDAVNEVSFNVICQVPGEYRGPASRAYVYYNADERFWVRPLEVEIK